MIQIKKSKYDNYCTCCRRPFDDSMEISFSHKDYNDSVNITLCGKCRRELMEALSKVETNCPEIPDSWVPVSERLPEEGHDVLITKEPFKIKGCEHEVIKAKRSVDPRSGKIEWWSPEFGTLTNKAVLAWMPLPEPYKEGEQHEQE